MTNNMRIVSIILLVVAAMGMASGCTECSSAGSKAPVRLLDLEKGSSVSLLSSDSLPLLAPGTVVLLREKPKQIPIGWSIAQIAVDGKDVVIGVLQQTGATANLWHSNLVVEPGVSSERDGQFIPVTILVRSAR